MTSEVQAPSVDAPFEKLLGRTTQRVRQLTTYLGAMAALIVGYYVFSKNLALPGSIALLIAGLPLVVTLLTDTLPAWLRQRRTRRLVEEGIHGELKDPGYFRLMPYEEADEERYWRPDNAHESVLEWIQKTDSPLLYLTGRSGTGKSSLLNAWVLPKLRTATPPFHTLVVRSFGDPVGALIAALRKPGAIWQRPPAEEPDVRKLLDKARIQLKPRQLLVAFDQFDEFLILKDSAERQGLERLLHSLTVDPIPGVIVLLACRSDYIGQLAKLDLPPLQGGQNWTEIGPFTEAVSRDFLMKSGLRMGQRLIDEIINEASEIEETKGLIRPITLNMFGVVLGRFAGAESRRLPKGLEPGGLIRNYLREAIDGPDLRDHAPAILRSMITPHGTKQPVSEAELADKTRLEPGAVRGCLLRLGNQGLVRRIDEHDGIWEISHDFVARLLDQILAKWQVSALRRLVPWIPSASLILWLVAVLAGFPFYGERVHLKAVQALSASGATTTATDTGFAVAFDRSAELSETDWRNLQILGSLQTLNLADTQVSDLQPLQNLTSLQTLALSFTQVSDLQPLENLTSLQTLNLSFTQVSDMEVAGLQDALPNVRIIR